MELAGCCVFKKQAWWYNRQLIKVQSGYWCINFNREAETRAVNDDRLNIK